MSDYTVEISGATKAYAGHLAVSDLSLSVPGGSVYGLLGPNGAGKTTTIRMMLNIIRPDSGAVRLFGQPYDTPGVLDRVGYLPEERGLYRKMEVRRMLLFLAELKGVPAKRAAPAVDEWLERLGLSTAGKDWGASKVDELSRGMQQKVQFIGTLLHDPELVILDEPFSGLDPVNAQALKDTVLSLKRRGRTVIFSTHVMENAERMCDFICIISGGVKVLDGEITGVKQRYGHRNVALATGGPGSDGLATLLSHSRLISRLSATNRFCEIELAPGADPQELLRLVLSAGVTVERFELVQPSLHQIFLDAVGAAGIESGMSVHG